MVPEVPPRIAGVTKKPSWSPVRRDHAVISGMAAISFSTSWSMRSVSLREVPAGEM